MTKEELKEKIDEFVEGQDDGYEREWFETDQDLYNLILNEFYNTLEV